MSLLRWYIYFNVTIRFYHHVWRGWEHFNFNACFITDAVGIPLSNVTLLWRHRHSLKTRAIRLLYWFCGFVVMVTSPVTMLNVWVANTRYHPTDASTGRALISTSQQTNTKSELPNDNRQNNVPKLMFNLEYNFSSDISYISFVSNGVFLHLPSPEKSSA